MKRLFRNGRYANVTATIALIVALGGTSYAAVTLPAKSVGPNQLKANAVTSAKIKANAVTSAKIGDGALLSTDFKAGQLPAGPQGIQGPTGDPATRLWAVVDATGAIIRRSNTSITSSDSGTSRVNVNFAQNVSNCAWIATVGPGTGSPTPGDASVGNDSGSPNTVVVFTDLSGGGASDRAFHIAVFC
jgi:hypothetical protein